MTTQTAKSERVSKAARRSGKRSTQKSESQPTSLDHLLAAELSDLYSAETQLIEALPKIAEMAQSPELKRVIQKHLEETQGQVQRLEQAFQLLGQDREDKTCAAMKAILKESQQLMAKASTPELKDVVIIGGAQRVEHYEIAGYGTLAAWADRIDRSDIAELLRQTLNEEYNADESLTAIAEHRVNPEAKGSSSLTGGQQQSSRRIGAVLAGTTTQSSADGATRSQFMPRDYDDRDEGRSSGRYGGGRYSQPYDDDDRGGSSGRGSYEGRSSGGRHSPQMQERDEYGQFAGYGGGSSGYGSSSRGRSGGGGYDDDDYRGGSASRGGYGSSSSRGGGSSSRGYDEDDYRGGSSGGGRGSNLSYEDRARGGRHSAREQERDEYGQFMGSSNRGGGSSGGGGGSRYRD